MSQAEKHMRLTVLLAKAVASLLEIEPSAEEQELAEEVRRRAAVLEAGLGEEG